MVLIIGRAYKLRLNYRTTAEVQRLAMFVFVHTLMSTGDAAVREARELQERALFYVAVSRAKREVLVTTSTTPSPFLQVLHP